ncbi:MAG: hypothetical protein COA78_32945 [Blastopirellula sp.]|nr:MAG: hypothetical protein COA78_32945 [Blastopirellula sp.]
MATQKIKDSICAKVKDAAANAPKKLASMKRWAICMLDEKVPWTVQNGKLKRGGHTLEENLLTLSDAVD